jgi:hypothetical protein
MNTMENNIELYAAQESSQAVVLIQEADKIYSLVPTRFWLDIWLPW